MKKSILTGSAALFFCIPLVACDSSPAPAPEPSPQDLFFERLSLLCGKAYAGTLVSDQEADADMAGKPMIMHAASCDLNEIQIPFHIAEGPDRWDRSRTWFITRTDDGLRLKHRHRHEDGSRTTYVLLEFEAPGSSRVQWVWTGPHSSQVSVRRDNSSPLNHTNTDN